MDGPGDTWMSAQMDKENEPGVQRGRKMDYTDHDEQYEQFLQDLEEDPEMRSQINLYKDADGIAQMDARQTRAAPAGASHAGGSGGGGGGDEDSDMEYDDDLPDVGLEELLDELTLGADEGDADETDFPFLAGQPGPSDAPSDTRGAAPSEAVKQFELPGGSEVKYYF